MGEKVRRVADLRTALIPEADRGRMILIGLFIVLAIALVTAFLSVRREYFTFHTETDYIGGFLQEAQRLINGEPLSVSFHPPFYPIVLALVSRVLPNWFTTGLVVSWVATVITLLATFFLFESLLDPFVAVGSIIAFLLSPVFITYSALATSDLFFLALYMSSLALVVQAVHRDNFLNWLAAGVAIALTTLTRANGLTISLLLITPWLMSHSFGDRMTRFLWMVIPYSATLAAWTGYAYFTGSPVWPESNYGNLALTYFSIGPDRISGEGRVLAEKQFSGIWSVIAHDPIHIIKTYVRDALRVTRQVFTTNNVVLVPVSLTAVYGLPIFLDRERSRWVHLIVVVTVLQALFVNLKAFEARYYLFLVPVLGALSAYGLRTLLDNLPPGMERKMVYLMALLVSIFGIFLSVTTAHKVIHFADSELGEVVPILRSSAEPDATLVARKPHLAYYAGLMATGFPDVSDSEDLKIALSDVPHPAYLYYGSIEARMRPQFSYLLDPANSPSWLKPIAKSRIDRVWMLYRIDFGADAPQGN